MSAMHRKRGKRERKEKHVLFAHLFVHLNGIFFNALSVSEGQQFGPKSFKVGA